ncbi:MAG: hypothetical protein U0270_24530 [Labilithrix sp.]
MLSWTKLGNVFDPRAVEGRPWLHEFAQAPATLLFDDFVRVYFSCRPPADDRGQFVSYLAYADFDRADLTRLLRVAEAPLLPLGDRGTFDEFGTYPMSALREGSLVRAYYGGWTRCVSVPFDVAIGVAESSDGGTFFSRLGPGPVLAASPDEPFILSGPKVRRFGDVYHLFYIAGRRWVLVDGKPEPVYKIRVARSTDGISFSKLGRDLLPNRLGDDEAQASPDVIFRNGRYHMFFCYRHASDFRTNRARSYRIGYAASRDLECWTRDDSVAGLDVSSEGWDSQMVAYPHVFEVDGRIYMYYLGNHVGRYGFGLARLEGDL